MATKWQQKWILGNWKMNGRLETSGALLHDLSLAANQTSQIYCGVAIPALYLPYALDWTSGSQLHIGAEDVSRFGTDGAYTGEISATMLTDIGVRFALIGHSERRQYFHENNTCLHQKLQNCLKAALIPVLCVGETSQQREAGQAENVVADQLAILTGLPVNEIVIAYEPVWAIGSGKIPTAAQIEQMHTFIYQRILSLCPKDVKIRVLYGGSVNQNNAAEIMTVRHVDGALVGGASLQADSFTAIIQAACAPLNKS